MFIASIILCAATETGTVDPNRCKALGDSRGPYETLAECEDRTDQMLLDIQASPLINQFLSSELGWPPAIVFRKNCVDNRTDTAV
jgi:hypothetical protein